MPVTLLLALPDTVGEPLTLPLLLEETLALTVWVAEAEPLTLPLGDGAEVRVLLWVNDSDTLPELDELDDTLAVPVTSGVIVVVPVADAPEVRESEGVTEGTLLKLDDAVLLLDTVALAGGGDDVGHGDALSDDDSDTVFEIAAEVVSDVDALPEAVPDPVSLAEGVGKPSWGPLFDAGTMGLRVADAVAVGGLAERLALTESLRVAVERDDFVAVAVAEPVADAVSV